MYTSELSHCRLKSSKETYATRGVATVHLVNHNNTLAGNGKFTYNAYNCSGKAANIMKAKQLLL